MNKLSIIIPVFNEERTIKQLLEKVIASRLPHGVKKEIVVVDDGSKDNTKSKIKDQKSKIIKKIFHEKNLGKGAAVRTGINHATGNLIIIQDADLEYNPNDYKKLLIPLITNKVEVVYGTRLTNYPLNLWGKDKTVLPTHLIANKFLTWLTNIIYGSRLTDMETGYKVFYKDILRSIILHSRGFDFEAEMTAKILKRGISIIEIPITTLPRTYKEGKKIGWKDGLMAIWTLIKYRITD